MYIYCMWYFCHNCLCTYTVTVLILILCKNNYRNESRDSTLLSIIIRLINIRTNHVSVVEMGWYTVMHSCIAMYIQASISMYVSILQIEHWYIDVLLNIDQQNVFCNRLKIWNEIFAEITFVTVLDLGLKLSPCFWLANGHICIMRGRLLANAFKGRGTWAFSYCFLVPMFSLGDAETQNSIFKIFRMH